MRETAESHELKGISSSDRLVQAMVATWETSGGAGVSVRAIAQSAGLPVSSIYYHFGDMERLFLAAQDNTRAAAEQWCAAHVDAIAAASDLAPEAFPALLAALIDDWAHAHRRLAFAWRECHLMGARDARYLPALRGWQQLWAGFWQEVCGRCGLSAFARLTHNLFDGESLLHMMQWRRAVDRACLDETCRGWGEWLAGRLAPEGPWRRFARAEASRSMLSLLDGGGVAGQIAAAAADTLAERGVAGLTHRAVAVRAGLSLGVVSYNFRTSADLLRAAFEMIYRRVLPFSPGEGTATTASERNRQVIDRILEQEAPNDRLLALDELLIAVARDPAFKPFSAQLRYLRGQTSGGSLEAMIGDGRTASPLDAALFSSLSIGQRRSTVGMTIEEARSEARQNMMLVLNTLSGERS